MNSILPLTQIEQWRWVQGWHANARGVLFGGQVLSWVDEDTTMLAYRVGKPGMAFTTAGMERVAFKSTGKPGDRLCFQYSLVHVGNSSVTIEGKVHSASNKSNKFLNDLPVFTGFATLVSVDYYGTPIQFVPHFNILRELEYLKDSPTWKLVEKIRAERRTDQELFQ